MGVSLKIFGARFRQIFGDPAKLSVGWRLIDAFATLEEREAQQRHDGEDEEPDGEIAEAPIHTAQAPEADANESQRELKPRASAAEVDRDGNA